MRRASALACVLLAVPLVVAAQQAGKVHHVGIVSAAAAPGRLTPHWRAFLEALGELGYVEGRNLLVTVELLKEAAPSTPRVAVVTGRGGPPGEIRNELHAAARQVGIELLFLEMDTPDQIDALLAGAKKSGCRALLVPLDGWTYLHRRPLVQLALRHQLPGIYWSRDYVDDGGLMAYGASLPDLGRRAAIIVDKVLKGAKPADLPVEQPTKFELVINMKTAKTLGLTVPPSLLLRADQVIE